METSKSEIDIGRRFYTCKLKDVRPLSILIKSSFHFEHTIQLKYVFPFSICVFPRADDGRGHLFKLCDEALFEELQSLQLAKIQQDDRIDMLTVGFNGERVDPPVIWARVSHHDTEIAELQQLIHQLQGTIDLYIGHLPCSLSPAIMSSLF